MPSSGGRQAKQTDRQVSWKVKSALQNGIYNIYVPNQKEWRTKEEKD